MRLKREWVVRVAEGATEPPAAPTGHSFYVLATLVHDGAGMTISDERETGVNVVDLKHQFEDHLVATNPHNITPAMIDALHVDDYGFQYQFLA